MGGTPGTDVRAHPRVDLRHVLSALTPVDDEAWKAFAPLLEPVGWKKDAHLVRPGERVRHAHFLEEGIVRVYHSHGGTEYNKTFFVAGMFPTALTALLTNTPCRLGFQALTPARTLRFPFAAFQDLFVEHRCLETIMRRVLEIEWSNKERHDIRMVTEDATANYLTFRKELPGLEDLVPQYHIASYLGVTPVQLSRIRAKLVGRG
ncbi:MAG: Crp/Fnr family transcriptional regulator [Flavobacteriales bacterium]|nr:Crp/Fnr family transcriptional regulator [Flavobacteriales bacterium]MCB9168408.1 Crp/Fnr family transcriptional regulator [Flavobacteriales bacterium]